MLKLHNNAMNNPDITIISGNAGEIRYDLFNAGSFYSDGGSAYGILPKAVWSKTYQSDNKNRIELACNLLLIRDRNRTILVDSGAGGIRSEKLQKIYTPQASRLTQALEILGLSESDIDTVVLTHLHHDHIGGLLSGSPDKPELTFPSATHIVQRSEWDIAMNPDELNKGAYLYRLPLDILQQTGTIKLIDGDYHLTESIKLIFAGGHSIGSQVVRVFNSGELLYYPGDIIPQKFHINPAVTSAYDISRQQTVAMKKMILNELNLKGGTLIFNHQVGKFTEIFSLT